VIHREITGPKLKGQKANRLIEVLGVALIAVVVTVWMTWPLPVQMESHSFNHVDALLNAYLQAWGTHTLVSHPTALFDTNMFYPAKDTFALSENLLGNQVFFAPVYLLTGNPNLGNNVVTLLSFVLCIYTMYWLVRWATRNGSAALIAGVVFAFAPARISQLGHNQLLSTQWLPLIVLFLYRFILRQKITDLIAFSSFILLQILCSLYLGYFGLLVAAIYFVAIVATQPSLLNRGTVSGLLVAAVTVAALLSPLLRPYERLRNGALRQDYELQVNASAEPCASYLDTNGHAYHDFLKRFHSHEYDSEKQLFVGFIPLGLAVFGLGAGFLPAPKRSLGARAENETQIPPGFLLGALLVTASSYILSLGPVLHIHDTPTSLRLPFLYLSKWIPGFSSFRAPARFGMLAMFGLGILAALGFALLSKRVDRYDRLRSQYLKGALAMAILFGICHEYRYAPFAPPGVMTPADLKPEYQWLAAQPMDSAALELPVKFYSNGAPDPYEEAGRVYASAFHWHKIVNGYSGYSPTVTPSMYRLASEMPSVEAVDILSGLGIRYVLLHRDEMPSAAPSWWAWDHPPDRLRKVAQFGSTQVFELATSNCKNDLRERGLLELQVPEASAANRGLPFELSLEASQNCWANANNAGRHRVVAEWRNQSSGRITRTTREMDWPIYLHARERIDKVDFVEAPKQPGTYMMTLELPREGVELARRQITLVRRIKPSDNEALVLSAAYELQSSSTQVEGKKITFQVKVTNTGTAVWVPGPHFGGIRLGYTWFDLHWKELSNDRLELPYEIYPGASYIFRPLLEAPSKPGSYVLKLELVSELVTWFHDRGVRPLEIPVNVR